ncbi:MAG TPA: hypothetical protein VMT53_00120 [Terriglobales bacterium]|nr:hypothetical protein [Terriglobales bacterium]
MPIHVGIVCESCERVYFIARTDRIEFLAETGEYQLVCPAPCGVSRRFDKQRLAPFSVKTPHYSRGYANRGEYELVRTPAGYTNTVDGNTGPFSASL